jgi:hypothetical protein
MRKILTSYWVVGWACTVKVNIDELHRFRTLDFFFEGVLFRTSLHPREAHSGCCRDFKMVNAESRPGDHLYAPCTPICKRAISDGCSCGQRIHRSRSNTAGSFGPSLRHAPSRLPQLGRPRRPRLSGIPGGKASGVSRVRQAEPQRTGQLLELAPQPSGLRIRKTFRWTAQPIVTPLIRKPGGAV